MIYLILNGFVAFGAIIAPIVGGTLSDAIGYPNSNDILALSSSSYTLAFVAVSAFAMRQPKNRLGGGNNHGHHLSVMRSNSSYKFKNSVDTRRYGNSLNQDNVGIEDQLLIKQFGDSYLKDNKLQDVKLQKEGNRTDQAPVDYQDDENRNNSFLSGQNQKGNHSQDQSKSDLQTSSQQTQDSKVQQESANIPVNKEDN